MIIYGQHSQVKVFADIIDEETINQIYTLSSQEFTKGLQIRIMPDCHQGKGCVIGTTMTIKNKIVPNLVGVDIGCGMLTVEMGKIDIDYEKVDNYIRERIPSGKEVHEKKQSFKTDISKLKCFLEINEKNRFYQSMGTLGGGNHFIEIDEDEEKNKYLIIHTGSRHLGVKIAEFYQEKAIEYQKNKILNKKEEINKIATSYKIQGRDKEIEKAINHIKALKVTPPMPLELCFLEGSLFDDYLFDMAIAQKYASENRYTIASKILSFLGLDIKNFSSFETIHNYINMNDMILRKGAISAYLNERVLIPINMRDGCILGRGKECADYNYSAPHGAGRILSRSMAKEQIKIEDYQKAMKGIYTTSVAKDTIDEAPFAYKPLKTILDNIKETVEVEKIIKPVYNYKASE